MMHTAQIDFNDTQFV